jgi:hypothetical protein
MSLDLKRGDDSRLEDGVDCVSSDEGGRRLQIQVTSPEVEFQRELSIRQIAERLEQDASAAVQRIVRAVACKATVDGRNEIVLAIDATDFPAYALLSEEVTTQYGSEVAAAGFKESGSWDRRSALSVESIPQGQSPCIV